MKLGVTIFGQMITFAIFVWFTMRFIWPLLMSALEVRRKKIADGLAAAEKGHAALAKAKAEIERELKTALAHREEIIAHANKHAERILADAKQEAKREHDDIIIAGKLQVAHELHAAKSELMGDIANMVVAGAEKILSRSIKGEDHRVLLDNVVQQFGQQKGNNT